MATMYCIMSARFLISWAAVTHEPPPPPSSWTPIHVGLTLTDADDGWMRVGPGRGTRRDAMGRWWPPHRTTHPTTYAMEVAFASEMKDLRAPENFTTSPSLSTPLAPAPCVEATSTPETKLSYSSRRGVHSMTRNIRRSPTPRPTEPGHSNSSGRRCRSHEQLAARIRRLRLAPPTTHASPAWPPVHIRPPPGVMRRRAPAGVGAAQRLRVGGTGARTAMCPATTTTLAALCLLFKSAVIQ
jgi:hypothetical protein